MSDAASSQAITVGDAIFKFFADTTDLDTGFQRIQDEAAASMGKAAASVSKVGDAATDAGTQLGVAGESATVAGAEIQAAGELSSQAMREAKGEVALLGEEFGIRLPRHVRGFVAELPGVGQALSAAFTATAVLFLIEALVKGSEKLSEWVANTFIYTQAMKDSDDAVKAQNKTLLELGQRIDKDKEALENFGKTQAELKSDKVTALKDEIAKNEIAFQAASKAAKDFATGANASVDEKILQKTEQLGGFLGTVATAYARIALGEQHVFDSIAAFFTGNKTPSQLAAEAKKAGQDTQDATQVTAKKAIDLGLQLTQAEREASAQRISDQEEAAKKSAALDETLGMAKIKRWVADATYEAQFSKDSAEKILQIQRDEADKEYQLKLQTLKKERAAEEAAAAQYSKVVHDPDSGKDLEVKKEAAEKEIQQIKATFAKIVALDAEHYKKEKQLAAESDAAILKLHADAAVASAQIGKGLFPDLPAVTSHLLSMDQAAAALGITLSKDVAKGVEDAKAALKVMDLELKAGKINTIDYSKAKLALVQLEIQQALATGKSTVALQKEGVALEKEIPKVDDAAKTHQKLQHAITQTDSAFNSFVFEMAAGSETIGQAAKKMAEQMIAALVSYAEKQGAADLAQGFSDLGDPIRASLAPAAFQGSALWFALAGAGSAAGGFLSGSGSGSSGSNPTNNVSSSSNPGGSSQTSSSGGGTSQTVNVPHLAAGGIVLKRTLLMAGDSPSGGDAPEAIVPLSDPAAIARFTSLLSPATMRAGSGMASAARAQAGAAAGGASAPQFDDASLEKLAGHFAAAHQASGGGGGTQLNVHVRGLLDSGTLKKTMNKYQKMIQRNQANFTSSNSYRVTKRSQ